MTEKRFPIRSLWQKYLLVTLLGAAVGVLVYLALAAFGGRMIDEVYMSAENVARRKAKIYSAFSSYVSARGVTGRDSAAVARWTATHGYVTIFLFDTGRSQQLYAGGEVVSRGAEGYDPAVHGKLYPVRFADGLYQIAIDDSSQLRQRQVVKIVSIVGAGLCFLILEFWYTDRLTRRIIALSKEANAVSSGELDRRRQLRRAGPAHPHRRGGRAFRPCRLDGGDAPVGDRAARQRKARLGGQRRADHLRLARHPHAHDLADRVSGAAARAGGRRGDPQAVHRLGLRHRPTARPSSSRT